TRVISAGGRHRFEDDQETPDTNVVTFDFPGHKSISWEGLSCSRMPAGRVADVVFHGETGTLLYSGGGCNLHDMMGGGKQRTPSEAGDVTHLRNFVESIRGGARLNSEIEEAHKSTLLCHLGNIAYRTSHTLACDTRDGHIQNDRPAMEMWSREYAPGFEPRV